MGLGNLSQDAVPVVRMEDLHEELGIACPLLDRVAEQGLDLRTRVDVGAERVDRIDVGDERQLLDERSIARLGFLKPLLHPFARVDVLDRGDDELRSSLLVTHEGGIDVSPDDAAVLADVALLHLVAVPAPGDQLTEQ